MKNEINSAELNKVAQITLLFWLMKIIATTLGETFGDYLSMTLNLGYGTGIIITASIFLIALGIQLAARTYLPIRYWFVIVSTTTFGTEISDFIDRSLHLGYLSGSLLLFGGLILTLFTWKIKFGEIIIYPIQERRVELFYWIAILFSNSLGTAFGDFLSDVIGLSYIHGAMVTAGVILLVLVLHYVTRIDGVILFWLAFIFTRPFGATFGDFLTKPIAKGGLNLGTLTASLVSLVLLCGFIFLAHMIHKRDMLGSNEN